MLLTSIPGGFLWATYHATISVLCAKKTFLNYFLLLQHKNTEETPQDPSHIYHSIPDILELLAPWYIHASQPNPSPARYYKILIPQDSWERRYLRTPKFLSIVGPRPRKFLCQTCTTNSSWNIHRPLWIAKWSQTWKNLYWSESCSTRGSSFLTRQSSEEESSSQSRREKIHPEGLKPWNSSRSVLFFQKSFGVMPILFHPGLRSLNPIQIYFPPFSNNNNKIWIPIITTEYDLGEKSKHSSNCDLLQFPAEVNKLRKHKRLQKILPVLVKTVFKLMQVVLVRLQRHIWVFP